MNDKTLGNMERQLKAGEPLGENEQHPQVAVFLLHVRLQSATKEPEEAVAL